MMESQLAELLEALKKEVTDREEIRHLGVVNEKSLFLPGTIKKEDEPADASYKAVIKNNDGQPVAFLICSNPVNTNLVARNVEKARQAAKVLMPRTASVIQTPILEGAYEKLSWALFSMKRPLADNKWRWRGQKVLLASVLADWLSDVIIDSKKDIEEEHIEEMIVSPLQDLSGDRQFPSDIRKAAEKAIARLTSGKLKPRSVLAHNDLWKGNIMLPARNAPADDQSKFCIIDWAGSSTRGFAFFDLMKLGQSLKFPAFYCRRIISKHCHILECDVEDAMSYLLAALAVLGRNLEHFPRHRYVDMSVGLCRLLAGTLKFKPIG